MIIALDSFYTEDVCNTSMVLFEKVDSNTCLYKDTIYTKVTSSYVPGEFYKRELPGIEKILTKFKCEHRELWEQVDLIIVDSFVYLATDAEHWDGLGAHLYHSLQKNGNNIPVLGVAKTNFGICNVLSETECVCRGESKKPLYVQGIGLSKYFDKKDFLEKMDGKYRIPTLLKEVDKLSRIY